MATRPIDEKIVVMRLDNSDFIQKAEETTGMFGRLRDGLNKIPGVNLDKTAKELGDIGKETNNIGMDKLAQGVQQVAGKFTNLGIVGVTALTNIANRAVDMGINLAKSLSVDQVTAGFQEYETKIGSIQTILANTQKHGTTLDDVTKSLGELNKYADQTIYSFGDMTRNIGLFTNAGLKLEESTSMIKGFSNAAAASGANAEDAARAAYQLSQGLSNGYIKQMDWMSLSNAGMGNNNMKKDLIALGQAMGTLNVSTDKTLKNWADTMSDEEWLTSGVMSTYLQAMAGDLDKAALKAKGLTDAQADLLLQNAKTGEESATLVRTYTQFIDGLQEAVGSGWASTFELIFGDFDEATKLWSALSNTIGAALVKTGEDRNAMIQSVKDKGGLANVFQGIQNAVIPLSQLFTAISSGFEKAFPPMSIDRIVQLTNSFKEFTAGLKISDERLVKITTIAQGAFSIFSTVIEIVKRLGSAFINIIPKGTGDGLLNFFTKIAEGLISFNASVKEGNGLTKIIDIIGNFTSTIGNSISSISNFSGSLTGTLGGAIDWLKTKLAPVAEWIKEAFSGFGGEDLLGAGATVGIVLLVKKIMGMFGDGGGILDDLKDMVSNIGGMFESLGESLQAFTLGIKIANLVLIAGALVMIAVSLKLLEGIDSEDVTKGLTALAVSLGVMLGAVALISKFNITGGMGASLTIMSLAGSVVIMAVALNEINKLNPEEMKKALIGLVTIVGALVGAIVILSSFGGKIAASSLQLLALAGAIYIIASSLTTLSELNGDDLTKSVLTLAGVFTSLGVFLKVADGSKFGPASAIGILAIATAIGMISTSIGVIGELDTEQIVKGLTTIAVLLTAIGVFSTVAGGPNMILAGTGMIILAGAISMLVEPIQTLGIIPLGELATGIGAIAVAMLAIAGAGLLANGAIGGAVAITVMAVAINAIIGPIQTLSNMTWEELIKGFVGLAGGMAVLATTSMLLAPTIVPMLGFAGALLAIGVAALAVGAGISLFGSGLAALASLTAVSVAAIVSALGLLIKGLGDLIIDVVAFIVKLGIALIDGIYKLLPPLVEMVVVVIIRLLQTIEQHLPEFLRVGIEIIVQLIAAIGQYTPVLVDAGVKAIVTLIQGLSDAIEDNGPALISVMLDLLGEIILLVVEAGVQTVVALLGWIPGVKSAATSIGEAAEKYIRENFGAKEVAEEKGTELATSLNAKQSDVQLAGENLGKAAEAGASKVNMTTLGEKYGLDFASGISSKTESVRSAATQLADASKSGIVKSIDIRSPGKETEKLGKHTGEGFAKGISKKEKSAAAAAKKVAAAAKTAFKDKMEAAEYKFKMGEIDSKGYVAELNKIKNQYSKNQEFVREVNLKIKKVESDSLKERFDNSKKWIDERKFYNEITLKEELAAWQKIQGQYKVGTDQRKEAEKKVYSLKKEIAKGEFENSKRWIDERKFYNEMSLKGELEVWEKLQDRYKEGTEERKEADKQVYALRKDLNDKLLEINNDYVSKVKDAQKELIDGEKALNDEYNNAYKERRSSLLNFAGLFSEITKDSEITGAQLVTNLSDQVGAFKSWQAEITKLSAKAIDDGLIAELKEMGPKALAEIRALNSLSANELQKYSDLYSEKSKLATEQANKELAPMKVNTEKAIDDLRKASGTKLDELQTDWKIKIKGVTNATESELNGLTQIGSDAVQGLINGMESRKGELEAVSREIGKVVDDAVRKELQIKSPSRVMTKIGGYVVDGVIAGIKDKTPDAIASATNLAQIISNAFSGGFYLPITTQLKPLLSANTESFINDYNAAMVYSTLGSEEKRLAIVKDFADKRAKVEEEFTNTYGEEMANRKKELIDYILEYDKTNGIHSDDYRTNTYVDSMMNNEYGHIIRKHSEDLSKLYTDEAINLNNITAYRSIAFNAQKSFMEKAISLYALSAEEQYDLYSEFAELYSKDSEEHKYFSDLKIQTLKNVQNEEKKSIDKRKKYNKLSLADELKAYEEYIKKYAEGSEERLYYEDKIADTKKAIHDKLIDLNEDYISKMKDLNDELAQAELDASNEVETGWREMTEKMNADLLSEQEAYNERVAELNQQLIEDEKALTDEYAQSVEDRRQSLYSFIGLFDKVEKKSGVSGKRLIRNLQGQVDVFKKWSNNMNSLSQRGIDQGLLDELRAMGPEAATEIAALNKLSDSELLKYSSIWKEKSELASNQAVDELVWLKDETADKIEELRYQAAIKLDEYADEWQDTNDRIVNETNEAMDALEKDVYDSLEELRDSTYEQLRAYEEDWAKAIGKIKDVTTGVFNAMEEEMPAIGKNAMDGLIKGLTDSIPALKGEATWIADVITDAIKNALDINSPSRVMEVLGGHTGQGLVNGIISKTKNLVEASKDFASSAKDSLNKFLDGFEIPRESEELHFKAVVDYEAFDISRFGKMDAIPLQPDLSYAQQSIAVARDYISAKSTQRIQPQVSMSGKQAVSEDTLINIHTTIELEGEVIARKTFQHTDNILGNKIADNMRYSGVR